MKRFEKIYYNTKDETLVLIRKGKKHVVPLDVFPNEFEKILNELYGPENKYNLSKTEAKQVFKIFLDNLLKDNLYLSE